MTPDEKPNGLQRPYSEWAPPAKYDVRRVLGTGAMGTVLLARDRNLGRLVALKVLRSECQDYLARLRVEARLLAKLEHPAIVRVHELDVHAGRLFLAMEYVPGGNLALARMEPRQLVRTLRGVVDALAHSHAMGVVHRDIKPQNVLLFGDRARPAQGRSPALLSDFGLAIGPTAESTDLRHAIVGTPLTMSPEQISPPHGRHPVGPASDMFSFGVTLYRMLTQRWPFPGRTVDDVFDAIRSSPPQPMEGVPRRLADIVQRTLQKDPAQRFSSMDELGSALDRFTAPRSIFGFARTEPRTSGTPTGPPIHPEDFA